MINCFGAGSYWPPAVPFPVRCCCFFLVMCFILQVSGSAQLYALRPWR